MYRAYCFLPVFLGALLSLILFFVGLTPVAVVPASADGGTDLTRGSRQEQILFWETELTKLRRGDISRAQQSLLFAEHTLREEKKRSGWLFVSEAARARIKLLEDEVEKNRAALAALQKTEEMMLAKVKPLYGFLSRRFVQEQRNAIANAIKQVQDISYDNAWYSSLFAMHEAETLTDLIVGFLFQWLFGYVILYPFVALFYAFWTSPWSIYAYSSGISDIFLGFIVWCGSVFFMFLPLLALVGGLFYIRKNYGRRVEEAFRAARERERR